MSLRDKIDQGRAAVRQGVQAVSAEDLYPTPLPIARRAVEALELGPNILTVLEPSAGTGMLLKALEEVSGELIITAIERDPRLAQLGAICADFLTMRPSYFDRIIMNPPFSKGADIEHVQHAQRFLTAGGIIVAIVADGPRQARAFEDWEDVERLPAGTFAGTNVRSRIIRWRNGQ